jgi:hypothetical protein
MKTAGQHCIIACRTVFPLLRSFSIVGQMCMQKTNALHLVYGDYPLEDEMVDFLLDVGVDPAHVNCCGETIYHLLMRNLFRYTSLESN